MYARKEIINYGTESLEVFQLPNGEYQLSMTQVAESIGKPTRSFSSDFLAGKSMEALPYKEYKFFEVFYEGVGRPVKALPIKLACGYWLYWAIKGNVKARALLAAGAEQVITQLADKAFGVERSADSYHQLLVKSIEQNNLLYSVVQNMQEQQQVILNELSLLRPAYEELQTLNKTFEEIKGLKPLLEEIAKVVDKPNQTKNSVRNWLKKLSLDSAVSSNQCKAIGRVVSDWLKVGNMEKYAEKSKSSFVYPESLVPLIRLATEYQLFHATR